MHDNFSTICLFIAENIQMHLPFCARKLAPLLELMHFSVPATILWFKMLHATAFLHMYIYTVHSTSTRYKVHTMVMHCDIGLIIGDFLLT